MARRRKAKRSRGKNVTVAVMVGMQETKHRGATLAQALRIAEALRLKSGCHFKWFARTKGGNVVKRLPGGVPGMDGAVFCNGVERSPAYALVYRPRAKRTGSGRDRRR